MCTNARLQIDRLLASHRLNLSLLWSLEACGPPITDIASLPEPEASLGFAGGFANYVGGHSKFRWARGRRAIADAFLETLQTASGATWDSFAVAYRPIFDEVECVKAVPEEDPPKSKLTLAEPAFERAVELLARDRFAMSVKSLVLHQ